MCLSCWSGHIFFFKAFFYQSGRLGYTADAQRQTIFFSFVDKSEASNSSPVLLKVFRFCLLKTPSLEIATGVGAVYFHRVKWFKRRISHPLSHVVSAPILIYHAPFESYVVTRPLINTIGLCSTGWIILQRVICQQFIFTKGGFFPRCSIHAREPLQWCTPERSVQNSDFNSLMGPFAAVRMSTIMVVKLVLAIYHHSVNGQQTQASRTNSKRLKWILKPLFHFF